MSSNEMFYREGDGAAKQDASLHADILGNDELSDEARRVMAEHARKEGRLSEEAIESMYGASDDS